MRERLRKPARARTCCQGNGPWGGEACAQLPDLAASDPALATMVPVAGPQLQHKGAQPEREEVGQSISLGAPGREVTSISVWGEARAPPVSPHEHRHVQDPPTKYL